MMKRLIVRVVGIGLLLLLAISHSNEASLASVAAQARPNILIILSDDMGFSDIGCYGSEISTPNLDSLAADGVHFTQFYNNARCSPTWASLLTGLYPHQAGIGHMMDNRGADGYRADLNRSSATIAEALKPAGYTTYAVGKRKLVAKENKPWELYDIAADRTEMNDLAAKHADKVKELAAEWDAWAARANVLPLGQWRAKVQQ